MNRFRLNIREKILLTLILTSFVLALVLNSVFTYTMTIMQSQSTKELDYQLREDFDRMIKSEVQIVVSLLDEIYNKSQRGEITLEDAKKLSTDIVRELRLEIRYLPPLYS